MKELWWWTWSDKALVLCQGNATSVQKCVWKCNTHWCRWMWLCFEKDMLSTHAHVSDVSGQGSNIMYYSHHQLWFQLSCKYTMFSIKKITSFYYKSPNQSVTILHLVCLITWWITRWMWVTPWEVIIAIKTSWLTRRWRCHFLGYTKPVDYFISRFPIRCLSQVYKVNPGFHFQKVIQVAVCNFLISNPGPYSSLK